MTDYIKRLRAGERSVRDGLRIRYLLIAEAHTSKRTTDAMWNRPHWHMLIHEQLGSQVLLPNEEYVTNTGKVFAQDNSFLKRKWTWGLSKFELARDTRTAVYLCKYLTKTLDVRVRASQRYGQGQ